MLLRNLHCLQLCFVKALVKALHSGDHPCHSSVLLFRAAACKAFPCRQAKQYQ